MGSKPDISILSVKVAFRCERSISNENDLSPVDPGVPKRPIRFKLSVKTGNPLLWVSQNLPANEATGHPPTKCKQLKKSMGSRNAYIADGTPWSSCPRGNKFECGGY